jgi:hypothetical protein
MSYEDLCKVNRHAIPSCEIIILHSFVLLLIACYKVTLFVLLLGSLLSGLINRF